jgi:hypothetical protein
MAITNGSLMLVYCCIALMNVRRVERQFCFYSRLTVIDIVGTKSKTYEQSSKQKQL